MEDFLKVVDILIWPITVSQIVRLLIEGFKDVLKQAGETDD